MLDKYPEIPNTLFSEEQKISLPKKFDISKEEYEKAEESILEWKNNLDLGLLDIESQYKDYLRDLMINALGYPRNKIKAETGEDNTRLDYSYTPASGKNGVLFELKSRNKKPFHPQGYKKSEQETPVDQAIAYIEKNPHIDYAVVTNFEEFILITRVDLRHQCYKFEFPPKGVKLLEKEIKEFIYFFSKHGIENGHIEKAKQNTIVQEDKITNNFYKLYHQTRLMLIHAYKHKNKIDHSDAIEIAQTFLNRLIFIFFAEDNELMKKGVIKNGIRTKLDTGNIKEKGTEISDFFNTLFLWMDEGNPDEIDNKCGFNGEFFKEPLDRNAFFYDFQTNAFFEDILKKVKVPSSIKLNNEDQQSVDQYSGRINPIIINIMKMASYNFEEVDSEKNQIKDSERINDEINVNILGHIFEQSIGDLEELKNDQISKRKTQGVFYTPEYITRYICNNTIIPYFSKKGATDPHELVVEYQDNLEELEDKFNDITILDPACGSGAFLVKSVDVLLSIYDEIQKMKQSKGEYLVSKKGKQELTSGKLLSFDKDSEKQKMLGIIQNNIFGVDINPESIEITKLSLFLKIATKEKQLIGLSQRITMGNSLVSDPSIDDKAFSWKDEFYEILGEHANKYGFDIILGNPPYVSQKGTTDHPNIEYAEREYYRNSYQSLSDSELKTRGGVKLNLFALWIEKSIELLGEKGTLGLIVHKNLLKVESYKFLRKFILENTIINEIFDLGPGIFEDVTGETVLLNIQKTKLDGNTVVVKRNIDLEKNQYDTSSISQNLFYKTDDFMFNPYRSSKFLRLQEKLWKNSDPLEQIYKVISFGLNTKDNKKYFLQSRKGPLWRKAVMGRNIAMWIPKSFGYVFYDDTVLTRTGDVGTFEASEKLIMQRISPKLIAAYDKDGLYCYNSTNMILPLYAEYNLKYLLCLLNSKLINYYYVIEFSLNAILTVNITQGYLSQIPIKKITPSQQKPFIKIADDILDLKSNFYSKKVEYVKMIETIKTDKDVGKNFLENFFEIEFDEFFNSLKKVLKTSISSTKEIELRNIFEEYKDNLLNIQLKIHQKEEEMNKLVYQLYDISKEEIERIESN